MTTESYEIDLIIEKLYRDYEELLKKCTCDSCTHCVTPEQAGLPNSDRIGFCLDAQEFIRLDDVPSDSGCYSYSER